MTNFDESKLTAYALGELDATESAQVEDYLKDNPEARRLVDEIRQVTRLVEAQLASEPALALTDDQRRRIRAGKRPRRVGRIILRGAMAAAAVFLMGVFITSIFAPGFWRKAVSVVWTDDVEMLRPADGVAAKETGPDPYGWDRRSEKATEGLVTGRSDGDTEAKSVIASGAYDLQDSAPTTPDAVAPPVDVADDSGVAELAGLGYAGGPRTDTHYLPTPSGNKDKLETAEEKLPAVTMYLARDMRSPEREPDYGHDSGGRIPDTEITVAGGYLDEGRTGQAGETGESWSAVAAYPKDWRELSFGLRSGGRRRALTDQDRQAYRVLGKRLQGLDVNNAEFGHVVAYLSEQAGGKMRVRWNQLAEAGVTPQTTVSIHQPDRRLGQMLSVIMVDLSDGQTLGFVVQDGAVTISTAEDLGVDAETVRRANASWNREAYRDIQDNPFKAVMDHPLSTFSIDVDTASYSNVRRMLNNNQLPPNGAVRIEELVNYFSYDYMPPSEEDPHPFAAHVDVADCPWQPGHQLVRVGLKGREVAAEKRPAGNFVFLLDVSGSMKPANKLPLVIKAMKMLVEQLSAEDRIAIVVYAGAAGLVLDSTPGDRKDLIVGKLEHLSAGGSTQGSAGIVRAYEVAAANFIEGGVNRVILCTDGDFNVGVTSESELVELITAEAKTGVFLTVLGFGMGNLQDDRLEALADKGNGNYGYIDSEAEARKVFVEQLTGTLVTIAKDVKIQIEFNPRKVAAYRLIGYENRLLAKEDFNDDTKDAGEIGAGHTVTALYELVPAGQPAPTADVDELKYQQPAAVADDGAFADELLTLKLRYKQPDGDTSTLMETPLIDRRREFAAAGEDFQFAAAVAAYGMILRDSPYCGTANMDAVIETAQAARGEDRGGYRLQFISLARRARDLMVARGPTE